MRLWLRLRWQGLALAIPAVAAASNTAFALYVESTVATLAFVLAITNILCPFLVRWQMQRHPIGKQNGKSLLN